MLSNLLPGLRDVRTPIVVGGLWLLWGWIVWSGDTVAPWLSRTFEHVEPLSRLLGAAAVAGSVSFAAYMLGSVMAIQIEGNRLAPKLIDFFSRMFRGARVMKRESQTTAAYHSMVAVADARVLDYIDATDITVEEVARAKAADNAELRARLLVAKPEVFSEYDRHMSEASLRLNLVPPLLAFVGLDVSVSWGPSGWAVGAGITFLSIALLYKGLERYHEGLTVLHRSALTSVFVHPVVELARRSDEAVNEIRRFARHVQAWGALTRVDWSGLAPDKLLTVDTDFQIFVRNEGDRPIQLLRYDRDMWTVGSDGELLDEIAFRMNPEPGALQVISPGDEAVFPDAAGCRTSREDQYPLLIRVWLEFNDSLGRRWIRDWDGEVKPADGW